MATELTRLIEENPFGGPFIFYGNTKDRPMSGKAIRQGFYEALAMAGISEAQRKERRIVFHSWRAYSNAKLRRKVSDASLRHVTRHKQPAMTELYDRLLPEDLVLVQKAQEEIASEIWSGI